MRPPLRYLTRKTDDRSANVYENKRQGQLVRDAEGKGLPQTLGASSPLPDLAWCGPVPRSPSRLAARDLRQATVLNDPWKRDIG